MTIDTGKRSVRMQSQKQLFAILVVVVVLLLWLTPMRQWLENHGVPLVYLVLILGVSYFTYYFYFIVRDVEYLLVSDTAVPNILRIRHFKLRPLETKKEAIEILQNQLYRYEVHRTRWGREYVVLWQNQGGQLFKYPPFSITILKRAEREALFQLLDQYVQVR